MHKKQNKKKSNFPFSGCLNKTLTRARKWQRTAGGYKLSILAGSGASAGSVGSEPNGQRSLFEQQDSQADIWHCSELKCSEWDFERRREATTAWWLRLSGSNGQSSECSEKHSASGLCGRIPLKFFSSTLVLIALLVKCSNCSNYFIISLGTFGK